MQGDSHGSATPPGDPLAGGPSGFDAEHALKNYLAIIIGYCELLIAETDLSDLRRSDLLEVERAARSALKLVNHEPET